MSDNTAMVPAQAGGQMVRADAPAVGGFNLGRGLVVGPDVVLAMVRVMSTDKTLPEAFRSEGAMLNAVLTSHQLGLPLTAVIRGSHFIKGKLGFSAELMLAAVMGSGTCERADVVELTPTVCRMSFKRKGHAAVEYSFTMAQAQAAGLTSNPLYKTYPERMLRARVVSWACRDLWPDVLAGCLEEHEAEEAAGREERREQPEPRKRSDPATVQKLRAMERDAREDRNGRLTRDNLDKFRDLWLAGLKDGRVVSGGETDAFCEHALAELEDLLDAKAAADEEDGDDASPNEVEA